MCGERVAECSGCGWCDGVCVCWCAGACVLIVCFLGCVLRFWFFVWFLVWLLVFNGFPFAVLKNTVLIVTYLSISTVRYCTVRQYCRRVERTVHVATDGLPDSRRRQTRRP